MREDKVHTPTVNIEVLAQILASHSCTLAVPSRETVAPWRRPAHDAFRLRTFPQGKVGRIMLFILSVQLAGSVQHIIQIAARQLAVVVVFVILGYIKVYRTFAFVCITVFQDFLYQLNLLDDMSRSMRLDTGR